MSLGRAAVAQRQSQADLRQQNYTVKPCPKNKKQKQMFWGQKHFIDSVMMHSLCVPISPPEAGKMHEYCDIDDDWCLWAGSQRCPQRVCKYPVLLTSVLLGEALRSRQEGGKMVVVARTEGAEFTSWFLKWGFTLSLVESISWSLYSETPS